MPGTTSTALSSFSHDQHHKTDAAKRKGGDGDGLGWTCPPHFFPEGVPGAVDGPSYCVFSMFKMAAVRHLGCHIFAIFVKNINLHLFLRPRAKFGEDRTIRGRVITYFRLAKWRPSAILDFHIFAIFAKKSILHLLIRLLQNLVNIG